MTQKSTAYLSDQYLQPDASYERLLAEYYRHGSLCIGFDFDGTVHDYHNEGIIYPLMTQLLRDLKEIGCTLVCWTCNKDLAYVAEYLLRNDIPFDGINIDGIKLPWETRKPYFSALLCDRAGLIQVFNELTRLVKEVKRGIHNRSECG